MRKTHALIQLLKVLQEDPTAEHWGYELSRRSGLRSGALYPILHRLLDAGWLEDGWEERQDINGKRPPRRYYVLTPRGRVGVAETLTEARLDARFGALLGELA